MKRLILVTGSHRSGSTWTGKILACAKHIRYVHEPFNIGNNPDNSPLNFWFEHLAGSSNEHQKQVKSYISSFFRIIHYNNFKTLLKIRSKKDLFRCIYQFKRQLACRTVLKDPIAIMSAEWLYKNFDIDVVVMIRHPAAFVASLKVKDWQFDFNNYLDQPFLMESYLKEYKDEIEDFSKNKKDIIDQGILLWNTIHHVIKYYQSKYDNEWNFVKHEDLSKNPIREFENIFLRLNLPFDANVKKYIHETTNSKEKSNLKRNSLKNIKSWKHRLTKKQIERIKKGTQNVWPEFYNESDW